MTRRQFVQRLPLATAAAGTLMGCDRSGGAPVAKPPGPPRVVIARDQRLAKGPARQHVELLGRMLDAGVMKLTSRPDAKQAWSSLFRPADVVGVKVNTLGRSTHPQVADAIVAGLRKAGVPERNIIIWDRFDVELQAAGYRLSKSSAGVRCYGTDAGPGTGVRGYERVVETSGEIGSCYSRIVTREVTALISAGVLKHHDLAGVSGTLKNFYGAIHNPNKYHDDGCSPYVADVVRHRHIAPKLRLGVIDAIEAQYHAGPGKHPGFSWPFAGLLMSCDLVALDRVSADIIDRQRMAKGMKTLAQDKRPITHVLTAAERGLGVADLGKIVRIEL